MYLIINNKRYSVQYRVVTEDSIIYYGVTDIPEDISNNIQMYSDDGFLFSDDIIENYLRYTYDNTRLILTNLPEQEDQTQTEEPIQYNSQKQINAAMKLASITAMAMNLTTDEIISVAPLYPEWTKGAYEIGDIRLATYQDIQQPWKCRQSHNTAIYPDITPNGSAWRTFWIPLHGTTKETALPFVKPTMAEDQYKTGEMMIWTDGTVKQAIMDTAYSPEEYSGAWINI